MEDLLETSPTGRAACHTCRSAIPKGSVRFGHAVPNPFSTSGNPKIDWHHVACAARTLPDKVRAALARFPAGFPERAAVEQLLGSAPESPVPVEEATLPTADRAPTDRARCGQCFSPISRGTVRVGVEREIETEAFKGKTTGWLHFGCTRTWAEANWPAGFEDFWDRVRANSSLTDADFAAPNSPPAPVPAPKDDARVRKVARLVAEGKRDAAAKELRLAASECPGWLWERVAAGDLAWDDAAVLDALGADSAAARPEALAAVVARIVGGPSLLPGLSARLFDLLGHVWRVQPGKLRAHADLPLPARVGVALLGARNGLPVGEDVRTAAVELLALASADPDCHDTDVTALAQELGVEEEAVAERALPGVLAAERPSMLASLLVLVRLDLPTLCARLASIDPGGVPGGLLVERRAARGEPPEAGLEILAALAGGTGSTAARALEELALAVARRLSTPPAAIDAHVLQELPVDDWRPVLRRIPSERLEAIRARVRSGSSPTAALTLEALAGGESARSAVQALVALAEQGRSATLREASLVGLGGAAVLPALLEEHSTRRATLPSDTKKVHPACRALAALRHALVVAAGAARADGAPDAPELDAFLLPDSAVFAHDDCCSLFFSSDRRAFQSSLASLPDPRRRAFAQAWRESGLPARTVETWLRWVMPET